MEQSETANKLEGDKGKISVPDYRYINFFQKRPRVFQTLVSLHVEGHLYQKEEKMNVKKTLFEKRVSYCGITREDEKP